MIETILNTSKSDARLAELLEEVREYAQIYLLAKQRHKGCQGTGELMTLKEEFRDTLEALIRHCKEQGVLPGTFSYDIDSIANLLMRSR
jgi:predicted methyltransferase